MFGAAENSLLGNRPVSVFWNLHLLRNSLKLDDTVEVLDANLRDDMVGGAELGTTLPFHVRADKAGKGEAAAKPMQISPLIGDEAPEIRSRFN